MKPKVSKYYFLECDSPSISNYVTTVEKMFKREFKTSATIVKVYRYVLRTFIKFLNFKDENCVLFQVIFSLSMVRQGDV